MADDAAAAARAAPAAPAWPPTVAHPRWRGGAVASAYLYQGLVAGAAATALPNHLAASGVPPGEVGAYLALVGLPWTLQPLWGPLVDRAGRSAMGRRRGWVVAALLLSHAALAAILLLAGDDPAAALGLVGALFALHGAAASLLDTAADALVVDRVPRRELGTASALSRGGFVAGGAIGAALFALALPALGFRGAVAVLLTACLLATALPFAVREDARDALLSPRLRPAAATGADAPPPPAAVPLGRFVLRLLARFRRGPALALLLACLVLDGATSVLGVRLAADLVRPGGGWEPGALSGLQAGAAFAVGTLGALAVGRWADRAGGPRRAALPLLAGCVLAYLAAALVLGRAGQPSGAWGAAALVLAATLPALLFVALVPVVARASRGGGGAATLFALHMAAMNAGGVAGAGLSDAAVTALGFGGVALASALAYAGVFALVARGLIAPAAPPPR